MMDRRLQTKACIAVVYLVRKAEGVEPIRRFILSYLAHDAGEPHDLVIVFKGFRVDEPEFLAVVSVLGAVQYRSFHIDDRGIDISAYLRAAEKLDHEFVCFLNTFSEIADSEWLAKLALNLRRPGVGLVGATASYESLQSSFFLLSKIIWLCNTMKVGYDENLARYYGWWIKSHAPAWLAKSPENFFARIKHRWESRIEYTNYSNQYQRYWTKCIEPGGAADWLSQIPRFPNPHIRSNGFMIARQGLLDFAFSEIRTKEDGCLFESGSGSLTACVRSLGLSTLIVGKDGRGYDISDWPSSRTFRLGCQDNLLIVDNQVRAFDNYSPEARAIHAFMTWGDYEQRLTVKFPCLGIKFGRSPDPL
jgi:hypothetical protein